MRWLLQTADTAFPSPFEKQCFGPTGLRPQERFTSCNCAYTSHVRWDFGGKHFHCTVQHWPFALLILYSVVIRCGPLTQSSCCVPFPPLSAQRQNGRESICSRHQQQRSKNLQLLPAERPHRQELGRWCGYMGPQDDKVRPRRQPVSRKGEELSDL